MVEPKAFVVIRMDEDGAHVIVTQEGRTLTEEEERWLAFLAMPHLKRFVYPNGGGVKAWSSSSTAR